MKKERRKQIMRYSPIVLTAMTLSSCIPTVATIAIVESHRHGDGQKENPYIIDSAEQLSLLSIHTGLGLVNITDKAQQCIVGSLHPGVPVCSGFGYIPQCHFHSFYFSSDINTSSLELISSIEFYFIDYIYIYIFLMFAFDFYHIHLFLFHFTGFVS